MTTISQPSDLVVGPKFVQADGTVIRWFLIDQLGELHHREDFAYEESGHGVEFGYSGRLVGQVGNVRFEEIVKTQKAKQGGDEFSDETQNRKGVNEKLWEEEVCVARRESHGVVMDYW
ncbi:hypothetical protein O6P43_024151 [Quillaja saponaria]|uniref:Uncharacterized protein n=1 Tax=Quillaja saponaria TaxID=32244 RepID=A0AAD7PE37_QUISA|nr:hypothetical protein O6P43_024151 [Quillaja saponaria]